MAQNEQSREELLLDLHLGQLDDDRRSWIEAELLRDAELRAASDRLGQMLRPLDYWTVTPPPPNLADRILRSIRGSIEESSDETIPGAVAPEAGPYRRRP